MKRSDHKPNVHYLFPILFLFSLISCSTRTELERYILPLELKRNKTHLSVTVGNITIPDIMLDSGLPFDGIMIYNPDYKDSLELTGAMEVRIGGAGSGEASMALMIDSASFKLGQLKMTNQRIIMLQGDIYKGFPSNGIIGYSILGHFMTELDYDNNRMILYQPGEYIPDESWTRVPIYFKDNTIPWVDVFVVIKNEPPILLSAYIDYASGDEIELLVKPEMKFILPDNTADRYLGRGLSGDIYGRSGEISKLIIGPYELNNLTTSFAPAEVRSKQDNADAILGNGSLKRFNLIFSYAEKVLYIKPNKSFNNPSE